MSFNRFRALFVCLLTAALFTEVTSVAQSGINSPYSRYGVGLLSDQSNGFLKGMGGVGTGIRMRNVINFKNPASYSMVDTLTFLADVGFSVQNGNFEENGVKVNARNARADYFAMQYRVHPKVGMTVAVLPYSNAGYSFSSDGLVRRDSDGEITYTGTYSGSGGLRQFMAGLGWRPSEWLSVGADVSYLQGNLTHASSITFSTSAVQSRYKTWSAEMSAFKFDLGAQATVKMPGGPLVVGITYSPACTPKDETMMTDIYSSSDTVNLTDAFKLPQQLGLGLSYKWKNCLAAMDVTWQNWSDAMFFGNRYGSDRLSAQAGFRIIPDEDSKKLFARSSYQGGLFFSQPYYRIGDVKGPAEYGISAGFSMPVSFAYNSLSYLHFSGQFVRVQPSSKDMITENYIRLNIGVTFMERWFMKWLVE